MTQTRSTERKRAPLAEVAEFAATESAKRRRVTKSPGGAAKAGPETSSVMADAMTLGLSRCEVLASFRRLVRANPTSEVTLHMVLADLAAADESGSAHGTPAKTAVHVAADGPRVPSAAALSPRTPAKQLMSADAAVPPGSPPVCSICLDPLDGRARFTTECSHTFHFSCIKEAVEKNNRSCPLCRKSFEEMMPPTTVPPPSAPADQPNWGLLLQALLSARVQALMSTQSTMRSLAQRSDGELSPTPSERRSASTRRSGENTPASPAASQEDDENAGGPFLFLQFFSPSDAQRRRRAADGESAVQPPRASARARRRRASEPRLTDASEPIGTLHNWEMVDATHARGEIVGHPIFPDNRMMTTAAIVERRGDLVRTINDSIYRLGPRASTG